jgi:hypothetical protein
VAYSYVVEGFMAFYSGNPYDRYMMVNRFVGPYYIVFWSLVACNLIIPQVLWSKKVRRSIAWLFAISLVVNMGMWLERFVIIATSLHREYLPSKWDMFYPTRWDWATLVGVFGLFGTLFYLFVRFLPVISIVEVRSLVHETSKERVQ